MAKVRFNGRSLMFLSVLFVGALIGTSVMGAMSVQGATVPVGFTVYKDASGYICAKNSVTSAINYRDVNGYKVVQYAINAATGPVVIKGMITLTYPIMPKSGTTLDMTAGGFIASNNNPRSLIEIIGVDNVKITGGKIDGNKAGQVDADQNGILIKRASNVIISYVTIVNTATDGVCVDGANGGSSNYARNIKIINCNFDECGKFHPGSAIRFMNVAGGVVSNCIIKNSLYNAITGSSRSTNIVIDGNQLLSSKLEQGIYFVDTKDMSITKNLIDSNKGTGIQVRCSLGGYIVTGILVSDNIISNNYGKGLRFEDNVATSTMQYVTITNNVVKNNRQGGLELARVVYAKVTNNNFYDDLSRHVQSLSIVSTQGVSDYGTIEGNRVQGYNGYTAIYHYSGGTWGSHTVIRSNICTAGVLGDKTA